MTSPDATTSARSGFTAQESPFSVQLTSGGGSGYLFIDDNRSKKFLALAPAVALVDDRGFVTFVAAGVGRFLVTSGRVSKFSSIAFAGTPVIPPPQLQPPGYQTPPSPPSPPYPGPPTPTSTPYPAGSLPKVVSDATDALLASKSAVESLLIYSSQDHENGVYVRNPQLWCASLAQQLTCASPWNSNFGPYKAGTLVTPRHILFSGHFPIADGATIRFVTAGNTVVTRTMVKSAPHPSFVGGLARYDFVIGVLDSDAPNTITPCLVPPANFQEYLHSSVPTLGIPCITLDQEEKALVIELTQGISAYGFTLAKTPATGTKRREFFETMVIYDSGNPWLMLINGALVCLTVVRADRVGPSLTAELTGVNQAIVNADTLAGISTVADASWPNAGGHYQLKQVNLSGFPNYA